MAAAALPLPLRDNLLLPALLLLGLAGVLGIQTGMLPTFAAHEANFAPPTVAIAPRPYAYRAPGEFQRGRTVVDAPLIEVATPPPLEIMKYQVNAADYRRCVTDGACRAAEPRRQGKGDLPATGVSFDDATAYAAWLSARTGATWRLPTLAEWSFAAGDKAVDPGLGTADADNPAARWLALYAREAELGTGALAAPRPLGHFGANAFGVADLGGSVWEWTTTCTGRTTIDAAGHVLAHTEMCGGRYLEGRHRSAMSAFIRDARGGGCSSGTPPDNLGFRLVRDPGPFETLAHLFGWGG